MAKCAGALAISIQLNKNTWTYDCAAWHSYRSSVN